MRGKLTFLLTGAGLCLTLMLPYTVTNAEEIESSIARGGKLYDKWYAVIDEKAPKANHPAYPADKKYAQKPKSNWRCKECHGWDGRGKDGAYSGGSHFTGIKGINGMAGAENPKIIAVLKGGTHAYADKLNDGDFNDLANFISKGQINMDKYIDSSTKAPKGNSAKGEVYFNTICSNCHGKDGFKPKDMGKTLGGQMGNPWEVMSKILNGQPNEQMPALRALDHQIIADIMSHIATLPKKR